MDPRTGQPQHVPDTTARREAFEPGDDTASRQRPAVAVELDVSSLPCSDVGWLRLALRLQSLAASSSHLSVTVPGCRPDVVPLIEDMLADTATECRVSSQSIEGVDVLPRSPLLAPEKGCCAWSAQALAVPSESAWFSTDIDLRTYVMPSGELDRNALGATLDAAIDAAEQHFDAACWPTAAMQLDAWMNRRVAVLPFGLASLHRQQRFTLSMLHQLTGWISARLQARSHQHALTRQVLPAIRSADPSRGMPPGALRDEWRQRWRRAVSTTRVRHRNLLALSAETLCFREKDSGRLNVDLLSLLQHADTLSVVPPAGLSPADDRRFHERLRAALQQRHALDQIAKHV